MPFRISLLTLLLILPTDHPALSQEQFAEITVGEAGLQQLTAHATYDHDATWSPDGQWLVFISRGANGGRLWKMPAEGGKKEQLTFGRG